MAWNKPNSNTVDATSSSRPSGRGKIPRLRRGLLAGVIVVLGAGIAAWLLTNGEADSRPLQKKDRGRIKEVNPAAAPKVTSEKHLQPSESKRKPETGKKEAQPSVRKQLYASDEEQAEAALTHGRKRPFRHQTEAFFAMFAIPGNIVPPVPYHKGLEKDFLESITDPIVIEDDDAEDVIQMKEIVAGMKEEAKAYIKAGGTLQGYFQELQVRQEKESGFRTDANVLVINSMKEGDLEGSYELWKKMNEQLDARGIRKLPLHPRLRQFGEADQQGVPASGPR